jgi:alpha/beta superfamily hydrolase
VRVALEYLAEKYPRLPITLCGFSFGARVGMEVGVRDPRVINLISIGSPVGKYDFDFLVSCNKPILFVHGEHDEFGSPDALQQLIAKMSAQLDIELVIVPGADHFFNGHLEELKQAIANWINKRLPEN